MAQEIEYRVFQAGSAEDIEAKLNEAAKAGFRLIHAVQTGEGGIFVITEGPVPVTEGESARTAGLTAGIGPVQARQGGETVESEDLIFTDPA
jgi:hypothetical protein